MKHFEHYCTPTVGATCRWPQLEFFGVEMVTGVKVRYSTFCESITFLSIFEYCIPNTFQTKGYWAKFTEISIYMA